MPAETELESMLVRLKGDGTSYQSMLEKAEHSTEHTAHQLEHTTHDIEGFSHSIEHFGESVVHTLEALGVEHFLHSAMEGFEHFEAQQIKLEAVLEGGGRNVEELTAQYKKFSQEVAHSSIVSGMEALQLLKTAGTFQLYGADAENAVKQAINLAAVTDRDAGSMMRFVAALEKGDTQLAMMFTRMIPQLRGVRDEQELLTKVRELSLAGERTQARLAETTEGALHHLSLAWLGLRSSLGRFVSEAMRPTVEAMLKFVNLLRGAPDEAKKAIVVTLGLGAAFLALGPAITVARLALHPLMPALRLLGSTVAFAVSPWGLLVAAAGAAGYAIVKFTGVSDVALQWFRERWMTLREEIEPAIEGVKAALESARFDLAFQIVWTQVKLTFARFTKDMQILWVDFAAIFQTQTANIAHGFTGMWNELVGASVRLIIDARVRLGQLTEAEAKRMKDAQREITAEDQKQADKRFNQLKDNIAKANALKLRGVEANIAGLEKERDDLVAMALKASEEAKSQMSKGPPAEIRAKVKVSAVAFESVEAAARVQEFLEDVLDPGGRGGRGGRGGGRRGGGGGGAQPAFNEPGLQEKLQDQGNRILGDIRDILRSRPEVDLEFANI